LRGNGPVVAKSRPVASVRPVQRARELRAHVQKAGDLIATAPDGAKWRSGLPIVGHHAVCPVMTIHSSSMKIRMPVLEPVWFPNRRRREPERTNRVAPVVVEAEGGAVVPLARIARCPRNRRKSTIH
jgi:hypothetical protein